jgi:ATP-dependent Clp protease ATP-binding subunit ClpC
VAGHDVVELFVRRTGLPEIFLRDDRPLRPQDVRDRLRAEVIGQDPACSVAADVVCAFKAGLNDPGKPVAVLLFCGPTGVGKTQLARSLSRFCFGHGEEKDRLLRLDMSEYSTPGAATRLLGDPALGGSDLVKRVRRQPFVVLLLDEVEKAAPEVFDVLLSLFDEGRLTDVYGRLTSFRSAIVIMTSNIGARSHDPVGFGDPATPGYADDVARFFRPELVNRIDEIVTFAPLSGETVRAIAEKELGEVVTREGLAARRIGVRWSAAVVERLAAEGTSARYGARDLQRTVERRVVIPLARYLIDHPDARELTLALDVGADGRIELEPASPRAPPRLR